MDFAEGNVCIPEECLRKIFQLLNKKSLKNASLVCRKWLKIIREDIKLSGYISLKSHQFKRNKLKPENLTRMLKRWPKIRTLEFDEELSTCVDENLSSTMQSDDSEKELRYREWKFRDKRAFPVLDKVIFNFNQEDGQEILSGGGKFYSNFGIARAWMPPGAKEFQPENILHLRTSWSNSNGAGNHQRDKAECLSLLSKMKRVEQIHFNIYDPGAYGTDDKDLVARLPFVKKFCGETSDDLDYHSDNFPIEYLIEGFWKANGKNMELDECYPELEICYKGTEKTFDCLADTVQMFYNLKKLSKLTIKKFDLEGLDDTRLEHYPECAKDGRFQCPIDVEHVVLVDCELEDFGEALNIWFPHARTVHYKFEKYFVPLTKTSPLDMFLKGDRQDIELNVLLISNVTPSEKDEESIETIFEHWTNCLNDVHHRNLAVEITTNERCLGLAIYKRYGERAVLVRGTSDYVFERATKRHAPLEDTYFLNHSDTNKRKYT